MGADTLVRVSELHRHYGSHHALRGLSFELSRGEVLGFLGPNGAGKTTTMQILCGALAPSAGAVEICGHDLLARPREAKRHVGYLPETPPLYDELSVDEYLTYAARLHGVGRARVREAVAEARARCGLGDVGARLLGNLSKGYRQRVGLAQAIVHEPAVVVLDEPTVGLDPNQIREIRDLVRELGREHGVLLSTHLLPEVQAVCDRVQIIDGGRLLLEAPLAELAPSGGAPSALRIELRRAPGHAELAALVPGGRVEGGAHGRYTLHAGDVPIDPERVAATAVERGWGLVELAPERPTLEEVFVALTCGDAGAVAPRETQAA